NLTAEARRAQRFAEFSFPKKPPRSPRLRGALEALSGGDDAVADGVADEVDYGVQAEFGHQVHAVRLDRLETDAESGGDFLVGLALREQLQDLAFARRQRRAGRGLVRRPHLVTGEEAGQHQLG